MKCKLEYGSMGFPIKFAMPPCVCGIDVRPGDYTTIIGDIVHSSKFEKRVLRTIFAGKLKDERECLFVMLNYGVRFCLIDARPETTLAKRLQEEAQRHYIEGFRAQYNTQPSAVEWTLNESEKLFTLEQTMTLDRVQHLFQEQSRVALPRNYADILKRQFLQEMISSTRTPMTWHGRDYNKWVERGPDHFFHAYNLMLHIASYSNLLDGPLEADGVISKGEVAKTVQDVDPDDPEYRRKFYQNAIYAGDEIVFDA